LGDRHGAPAAPAGRPRDRMMDRLVFIAMVGGSILATPLVAEAQQQTQLQRVGVLTPAVSSTVRDCGRPFATACASLGGTKDATSSSSTGRQKETFIASRPSPRS